ncbi:glutaminase domain-containing protein [Gaoshiqia sp. Z1-71]|uniref:glutaminase domain-containing protein n=1 Tax=Gaoshiqia hydrogeniformans TaxID=3290090 RepID=UPI003BF90E45
MKQPIYLIYLICLLTASGCGKYEKQDVLRNNLRAPAYPLVTIDPYTSAWSMTDKLYDQPVKHWTGKEFPLTGAIRVDGKTYRFMGTEQSPVKKIAPMSTEKAWTGKYRVDDPGEGWEKPDFNDTSWIEGEAAFGTPTEENINTPWQTPEIWIRRSIQIKEDLSEKKIFLKYSHDDIFELYINGILIIKTGYEWNKNVIVSLPDEVKSTLKPGQTVIAANCYNKTGGGLVDFGLYAEDEIGTCLSQTAVQQSADVQATQTHYTFECGRVELKLSFLAPLLLNQLDLISRPVNYIYYNVRSLDGEKHDVQIYFEASPNWALNIPSQENRGGGFEKDGLLFLKTGSVKQKVLGKRGDNIRIDWGYFYLSSEKTNSYYQTGNPYRMRHEFAQSGNLSGDVVPKEDASLALSRSLGNTRSASGKIMIGYDDLYSMHYFGENLRPYWNKNGDRTIEQAFAQANRDFGELRGRCSRFDYRLMLDAWNAGGKEYAELCALAYRQSISAHKLAESPEGELLFLSKENYSNGMMGTVDVAHPSAPLFLSYNPVLAKGMLNPIFYYCKSDKWNKPFPAHDIGTYPWATGQNYRGDMPVEESGNMLILTAAIAATEGHARYAEKHWDILTVWADYLLANGLDPENQLCTDDFTGHLVHNVNLSVKAIIGIACYGKLAKMLGKDEVAEKYTSEAKRMAGEWVKMADDGDHYRLTFDQPGTWSQKYNLVWDKLLKLDVFPAEVAQKEMAYYLTKQNTYGLPLDSRRNYTKADWVVWTAALSNDQETFQKLIHPLHRFMNETTDRVPMSDWYHTDSKRHVGFRARSVVGGYYIRLLEERLR